MYAVDGLTDPVMRCTLVLPFRERVITIGQDHFGPGVVVFVCPTKNCVKAKLPPKQVPEDALAKV